MVATRAIRSTPLRPLASRMLRLTKECQEFWVASAFVTQNAVTSILGEAEKAKAHVKFLTGTFGNNTRKSTFQELLDIQERQSAEVRIWNCGRHRNLHAKLYIWRLSGGNCVAWIGSANFTDGGLQEAGELLLELRASEKSPTMKKLRAAFSSEWMQGDPLDKSFIQSYKEAPRPAPDSHPIKNRHRPPTIPTTTSGRLFTTYVSRHHGEHSRVARQVTDLLPGTAENWYRSNFKKLQRVRKGDRCLLIDVIDGDFALVQVTDTARNGKHSIFAYEEITQWRSWTQQMRTKLDVAGLRGKGRALGVQWVEPVVASAVLQVINPSATR